jgi:eukaryotic-like serine/threonine-protein kinase
VIGQTIKDFKITERLGSGGFGEVWAAEQQIVHTRVAIKLLRADIPASRHDVKRFFREAVAAGRVKHAGIVKIFDVGFHAGRAFLIMELLEGETLLSRIGRVGRLPAGDVAEIGRQIASILEATDAEGIVHRDLKPENMFLVRDAELASKERVKVLDFGFAKLDRGLTASGQTMGTPAYIAPEQWANASKVDGRADLYSLGCVVFQMCCGRTPFVATTIPEWYAKHREERPPRVRSLVPELPAELDDLIERMLAKSPADRPAVRDIGAAFTRLVAAYSSTRDITMPPVASPTRPPGEPGEIDPLPDDGTPAPEPSGEERPPRWRLIAGVGTMAGIAVMAAIALFVTTRDDARELAQPDAPRVPADAPRVPADAPPGPPRPEVIANRWVKIEPPARPYPLGVADNAPTEQIGFRASRGIVTPDQPYEIQEHEVTWSELEPWLARTGTLVAHPPWAAEASTRARLPATNLTWSAAQAYCQSLGGALPTEEQWEYAARGPERRGNPWGADPLDRQMTRAFAGPAAAPSPVMENRQDRTPGPGGPVWDLAGNVQEWTLGLWREDLPGRDESDVQRGTTTARALRGLPLAAPPPASLPPDSVAFRQRLCATGPCVEKTREILPYVGVRCTRPRAE